MLVAGEIDHDGAGPADDHQRRGHVDPVDACRVHAAHLEQVRAQAELRRIARLCALPALGRFGLGGWQRLRLRFDRAIALIALSAGEVEGVERLLEREQAFGTSDTLQARDEGAQDGLTEDAGHVGDRRGERDVHLHQGLLHGPCAAGCSNAEAQGEPRTPPRRDTKRA